MGCLLESISQSQVTHKEKWARLGQTALFLLFLLLLLLLLWCVVVVCVDVV